MTFKDKNTKLLRQPSEPGYIVYYDKNEEHVLPRSIRELFVWNDIVRSVAVRLEEENRSQSVQGVVGDADEMTLKHLCDLIGDRYVEELASGVVDWQEAAVALFRLIQLAEAQRDIKLLANRNDILRYDVSNDCFFPNK